jgi:hypothetical protein
MPPRPKPQDHQEKAPDTFEWDAPDGSVITLPSMSRLSAGLLRKTRKLEFVDAFFTILEGVASEEALAQVDKLELSDFNRLVEAWQGQDGASLGESSASSS